ncbi:MAG: type II and III secretion system protein family protein [Gammaproteobacteria bacterium]|nr:type II and III secretion system protein family protein [Gammaproteobacteria bacterium]
MSIQLALTMHPAKSWGNIGNFVRVLLIAALCAVTSTATSAERKDYVLEFGAKQSQFSLSVGKSQIIYSPKSLDQVVIGSPEVADIKLLSSRQVLILGKEPGRTNLVFRDKARSLIAVIDVVVGYDLDAIKRNVFEALPHERNIEVRGENDAVMISGEVSSLLSMDTALAIASSYVPKKKVLNMLHVGGGQQVMLTAKISEVARSSLRELGVQTQFDKVIGVNDYTISTGVGLSNPFGSFVSNTLDTSFDLVKLQINALETKGLAKTLAEPNLIALSGQEASFLAGGEFPVPVAQSTGATGALAPTITIEYKEFGVGLKFTPTVLSNKKINLKLNTEVSAIDQSLSTAVGGGISVPGLTTRRAGTTVEVADGQSFAIAGLVQSDMNNAIDQVPGLGDIPILGALFRSTKFQRNETELVIVVTPQIVTPVPGRKLSYPTDNFIPPNSFDQYLMGRLSKFKIKKQATATEAEADTPTSTDPASAEGVEGSFGHQE